MANIKDVAALAGVSITTVSMVLNNKDNKISEPTRRKVLKAAEELAYMPNKFASSLSAKSSNLMMLMIPDLTNPFFSLLADKLTKLADSMDYLIYIYNSNSLKFNEARVRNLLSSKQIAASFIVDRRIRDFEKDVIRDNNIIFLDEFDYANSDVNIVTGDNEKGGYLAIKYLLDKGFRKIGLNIGPRDTPNSTRRLSGALKCFMDYGINLPSENIFHGNYTYQGGAECGKYFSKMDLEAIFSFSDISSFGMMEYFNEKGIDVPGDISIISYDNLFMDELIRPKLTSIDQGIEKIVSSAMDMAKCLIEGKDYTKKVLIEPRIVERGSVRNI